MEIVQGPTVLWDMVDGPMPRGLLGCGDPDVHVIDDTTTMFLGGFSTSFRNRLYRAVLVDGDPVSGTWELDVNSRGRVRPLVADPPRGAWDGAGMHTPSYVPGTDSHPARMFYTGRANRRHYGAASRYAIGVLELVDGRWVRHREPVIEGDAERRSVLEPLVVHDGEQYVMWFQANPHEIGPGDLPDYELRAATSPDAIHWSEPEVFASPREGFFDNAVARCGDEWLMVLCAGSNLHRMPEFPPQGIWISTCPTPSPHRADWSDPVRILDTDAPGTPDWLARGAYGPGVVATGPQSLAVFYTATRAASRWTRFALDRLRSGNGLPVPAPFYLATGAMQLATGTK